MSDVSTDLFDFDRYYYSEIFVNCPIEYLYIGRNLRLAIDKWNDISPYFRSSPFYNLSTLKEVVIGDSVTTLNDYMFRKCTNLAKVVTGNSVTSIPQTAFSDCTIRDLTLGKSVSLIESKAFCYNYSYSSHTRLYSLNTTPPSVGSGTFFYNDYLYLKVYVPQEALEAYQNADPWKNFWNLQAIKPTAISATEANYGAGIDANAVAYDLNGNRVEDWQSKKGMYIVRSGGKSKKVVIQ